MSDQEIMRLCFALAKKGEGFADPNPLVGAIVIKRNKIIGQGYHRAFGKSHAEIEALKSCTENPTGATLYINLEPCCHFGKPPPCTETIIGAGIKKVIISNTDPNPKVRGEGIRILKKAGIEVLKGVLEKEGIELNKSFFKWVKTGLPYITLKVAISSNGMIAKANKRPVKITCQKSDQLVHKLRNKNQAILVGVNTILSDNPRLTCRLKNKKRNPLRIILDSTLRTPASSKTTKNKNFLIATTKNANQKKLKNWNQKNIWISPTEKKVSLKKFLKFLGSQGITSVLVEGGRTVIDNFFTEKLIDEIYLFISPEKIESGLPWSLKQKKLKIKSINTSLIGSDTLVHGIL